MKDLNKIIGNLGQSGLLSGLAGGLAGGTLVGALTSKSGKKLGKTALKAGALAAVGGLAWKAYKSYSQRSAGSVASSFAAPATNGLISQQRFEAVVDDRPDNPGQMLILRSMIAAANADGHIDNAEQQRIFEQVEQMELTSNDKAALFDELRHPLAMETLVRLIPNTETAIEVYTASLMAIDENQAASVRYLRQLAEKLELPGELVSTLHNEVAGAKENSVVSVA